MGERGAELDLSRLSQVLGHIPDNLRPHLIGFFYRVTVDILQHRTAVEVDEDDEMTVITGVRRVSPAELSRYQRRFRDVLKDGSLNPDRVQPSGYSPRRP